MNHVSRLSLVILSLACLCISVVEAARAADDKTKQVKLGDITIVVPVTWKQQPPANKLRLAQFEVPAHGDDKEAAEISAFNFGGGNTVEDNVERWKGQFLPAQRQFSMEQGKIKLGDYVLVELAGTYKKPTGPPFQRRTTPMPGAKMLVTMISTEQGTYFIKLVGPNDTVTAAAADFRKSIGAPAKKPATTEE